MLKVHDYIEHSARIIFDCPHCEKEQTEILSSGTNLAYCDNCKATFVVELDEVVKHTLKFYTLQREKEIGNCDGCDYVEKNVWEVK